MTAFGFGEMMCWGGLTIHECMALDASQIAATIPADDPSSFVSVPNASTNLGGVSARGRTEEAPLLLDPYLGPVARAGNHSCARGSTRNTLRVRLRARPCLSLPAFARHPSVQPRRPKYPKAVIAKIMFFRGPRTI